MATTILLYGRSGAGKSTQIGVLAEHVYTQLGLKTRLATADRGGYGPIEPYVELGIIEPVELGDSDPFVWINKVCQGYIRDDKGKWTLDKGRNAGVGLWVFESMRAMAEALLTDMNKKLTAGVNIGGGSNISFRVQGDGESLVVGGSNIAVFGVAQAYMTENIWASQRLPGKYVLWTSTVSKDEDLTSSGKVLGPDVIGKALTAETPRWFSYTMRLDVLPAQGARPERHLLYLGTHTDVNAGNVAAMGNVRLPLDAKPLEKTVIEPANIVQALQWLEEKGRTEAIETIRKRLGL